MGLEYDVGAKAILKMSGLNHEGGWLGPLRYDRSGPTSLANGADSLQTLLG